MNLDSLNNKNKIKVSFINTNQMYTVQNILEFILNNNIEKLKSYLKPYLNYSSYIYVSNNFQPICRQNSNINIKDLKLISVNYVHNRQLCWTILFSYIVQ